MKVVIVHNDLRVYWKGRIKYLRQFLADHHITLYAIELFGQGSPYAFDPLDTDNCLFPGHSYNELTKAEIKNKLFAKLDEINPDVIIGGSIVFFSGALGVNWCRKHHKHFIMFDDGKPSDIKRNPFVQYIKDTIIGLADALWLPSADYDAEYTGVFEKPWFFHGYNTIDNELFKTNRKKEFNHNVIICVARLVAIKNIDNLLRAWQHVEQQNDTYKLQIVGSGPEQDSLMQLQADLQLKRVEFLGVVANKDIPAYLFNADAFILASFAESWGLVVNEAMAAALPVLLSKKINAANALLQEGGNGFVFDPYDVNEIAGKILKFIMLDEASKKAMSDRSLQLINTMDYKNMGNALLTILNEMAALKPKRVTFTGKLFMSLWYGGYNTAGWNK
ncbi:glycosyltransferase family 4 protein [Mucilaginibacter sp. UR6-11]|uniref:glycosyltransferase family 4 protein n=1 Tax=Mucilaginibacter sp. UR6-11 TaxID=1435644 RepID=UPI001E3DEECA|nr:glycosyltransferase family 4 protein [Mucilaginibacter sp. UR6-11]MCC8426191.1 glycosyltransferase family 4 protein [Mucilaginibacter sp. UR6-11]